MEKSDNISFCGMDCSACIIRNDVGCDGCKNMDEPFWGGICEIKDCATVRGLSNCSFCNDFPCELLLDISLDPDTGDDGARIETLRLMKDNRDDRRTGLYRKALLGGALGAMAGLLLAGITGGGLTWFYTLGGGDYRSIPQTPDDIWIYMFIGAAAGIALPLIIEFIKRYNKNG